MSNALPPDPRHRNPPEMREIPGETLDQRMRRSGGRIPSHALVALIAPLLDALGALHAAGGVHGSIDPQTVHLGHDGTVRLLPAPARDPHSFEATAFLAPEQARGEAASVDAQTDLWAVGAVMFTALTGAYVYPGATPDIMRSRATMESSTTVRTLMPGLEPDVAEVVDRALASTKALRWPSASAMTAAVRAARFAHAASAPPPPMAPYPQQQQPQQQQQQSGYPQQQQPQQQPQQGGYPQQQQQPLAPMHAAGPPSNGNGWVKWAAGCAVLIVLFILGAGVIGFLAFRMTKKAKTAAAEQAALNWSDEASPVPVSSRDPVWGDRAAPVTVVAFSDLQCPFCKKVEPTLEEVKASYGKSKVRIVWKNQPLPFHTNAKPAAEAAQVVFSLKGSDAFFTFHDLAFQNQSQLSPQSYRSWALASGVLAKDYDRGIAAGTASSKVDEDMALAKRIGATGTPTFRINGVLLSGAQPFEKFKSVIDEELAKANAKIATGTAKDRVYVVMSTENFAQPAAANKDDDPPADTTTVFRVPVKGSPVRGNVDAPVTIVEFSDFQCPFCKRVETTIDKVRDSYGDKVRIVWKHNPLPFHPRAEPAAELALEARVKGGDAAFFRAHDKLFDSAPRLEDADLQRIGVQLGLDGSKVKTAIRDKTHARDIQTDVDLADDVKASGTPYFFVNGRRLSGAQPFEQFQKIIDEELKKFDAQKGSVPAKDYYDHLMRDAQGTPEPERKIAPPVPAGAPFRGGKNAKVVIQEWADFQCPFCVRAEATLVELQKLYGDKIKLVWRDKPLPMHPQAEIAAELAREALAERGPDAFWKMHDKLFANQQRLRREDLDGYAIDLKLDAAKVARALDGKTHKPAIDADDKVGTDLGFSGTPTFMINDYVLTGAQPVAKFQKLIDRALSEAR